MKEFLVVVGILAVSYVIGIRCTTVEKQSFFGATIKGKYNYLFDGEMICAKVKGWHGTKTKCMCMLTRKDPRLGNDRTLISAEPKACGTQTNDAAPEGK